MKFDKSKLPSRHVSVGVKSSPHRSMYYAMGLKSEDIQKPFVGVATTWNEAAPCNITLSRQAHLQKKELSKLVVLLESLQQLQLLMGLLWDMQE